MHKSNINKTTTFICNTPYMCPRSNDPNINKQYNSSLHLCTLGFGLRLLSQLLGSCLLDLGLLSLGTSGHDTTSPVPADLFCTLIEVR